MANYIHHFLEIPIQRSQASFWFKKLSQMRGLSDFSSKSLVKSWGGKIVSKNRARWPIFLEGYLRNRLFMILALKYFYDFIDFL